MSTTHFFFSAYTVHHLSYSAAMLSQHHAHDERLPGASQLI